MYRLTRIIIVAIFLTMCHLQGMTQELVTPPNGLPEERWELTYDDYRARAHDSFDVSEYNRHPDYPMIPSRDDLVGLRREVTLVRNGSDVYIKGIFGEYRKAWIKCRIEGDRLTIPNNQLIDPDGPVYFHWGSSLLTCGWVHVHKEEYRSVDYVDFKSGNDRISFIVADDGCSVTSRKPNDYLEARTYNTPDPSFWFDNDERGDWLFSSDLGGYPDLGYMVNMVFRKVGNHGN